MIAISWYGLSQYAARLIRAFSDQVQEEVLVLGVRPQVPVRGMEAVLGHPIIWIEEMADITSWQELGLTVPEIFVQSGWACHSFNVLGKEVKRHGGRVIGLCDNNWRGDLRQLLGGVFFRFRYRRSFDAILVPGRSSSKMMRFYGMPKHRVSSGLYGADPKLFAAGPALEARPKQFLFVGQFVARKGVDVLRKAFIRVHQEHPEWRLRLCGNGPLLKHFCDIPGMSVDAFVQPENLSEIYHEARFLVLPSLQENWGLVVHEATLCGCALLLSKAVGSGQDLATASNAILFSAGNEEALYRAMTEAITWTDEQYQEAAHVSLKKADQFGPQRFAVSLRTLIEEVRSNS